MAWTRQNSPDSSQTRRAQHWRVADIVAGYFGCLGCWRVPLPANDGRPRNIPAFSDRATLYARTALICLIAGCAISAALSAITLDIGPPPFVATAGVVVAAIVSAILTGLVRARYDAFPDNPEAVPRLHAFNTRAAVVLLAGLAAAIAPRFVPIPSDWMLLVAFLAIEGSLIGLGAGFAALSSMYAWPGAAARAYASIETEPDAHLRTYLSAFFAASHPGPPAATTEEIDHVHRNTNGSGTAPGPGPGERAPAHRPRV